MVQLWNKRLLPCALLRHSVDGTESAITPVTSCLHLLGSRVAGSVCTQRVGSEMPSSPDMLMRLLGDRTVTLGCQCSVNCFLAYRWGCSRDCENLPRGRRPAVAVRHGPLPWGTAPLSFIPVSASMLVTTDLLLHVCYWNHRQGCREPLKTLVSPSPWWVASLWQEEGMNLEPSTCR